MEARFVALPDVSPDDLSAWRQLADRSLEPNPFFEPAVVLPAVRHLERPAGLALVVVTDTTTSGAEWRACWPIHTEPRWKVAAAQSWNHDYSFLGAPLVDDRDPVGALRCAFTFLAAEVPARLLVIERFPTDGAVAEAFAGVAAAERRELRIHEPFERAVLSSASERNLGTGSHRREIRRLRRRLVAELGGADLELVDRAGDANAVERFLTLEASGWKGANGTGTAFACRPGHDEFLRHVCDEMARSGRLRMWSLETGGQSVAMLCTMVTDGVEFWFKTAFDDAHARWSPGIHLMEDVSDTMEHGSVKLMDSCANPANRTINRMWPARRQMGTLLLPFPGRGNDLLTRTLSRIASARDDLSERS